MTVRQQIIRLIYIAAYAMYRRIRLFVIPALVIPIVVMVQGLTAEKSYVNHASILLEESALLNPFLDDLSFSFELSERIDALKTLVLSRQILADVASKTELYNSSASLLEKEHIQEKLRQGLSISMVGDELVRVNFKWHQPEKMKMVLELIVEAFIEKLLSPTKTSLDTSELFFKAQIENLRSDLEVADNELAAFRSKHSNELPQLFVSNQDALRDLEQQRQIKRVELSGIKARLKMLETKLGKANPVVGILEDKIIRAESDLALLRTRYTEKHSKINLRIKEIESLKLKQREILDSSSAAQSDDIERLWQIANTLPSSDPDSEQNLFITQIVALQEVRNQYAQIAEELSMLDSQVNELTTRLTQSSEVEKQLRILQRDYEVKTDLYRDMLSRYEMAKVTGKLVRYEGPDKIKQIERAYSPTKPLNSPLWVVIIVGVVLGLAGGVMFVFVAELLDPTLKDKITVQKIAFEPVISVLPIIDGKAEPNVLEVHDAKSNNQNK